jgi:hypothetical protein
MPAPTIFPYDVQIQGSLQVNGTRSPSIARSELTQENLAVYPLNHTDWRVWDAVQTNLPGTGATDDLAIIGGTFGTGVPSIQTGDLKNAGATTRYARIKFQLPPEYVAGETVTLRAYAGMVTTVASSSATIDFEVYKTDRGILVSGSDICATSATTINSLTFANKDFTITATSLSPGDILDIRLAIAVSDTATGTAVIGCAGSIEFLLDIKG